MRQPTIFIYYLTVTICPPSRVMSFIWAIKMAATASYSAVPSMLMVAPMGSTKRVTRLSTFRFSSRQRKVTGNVPALREEEEEEDDSVTNVKGHKISRQVARDKRCRGEEGGDGCREIRVDSQQLVSDTVAILQHVN